MIPSTTLILLLLFFTISTTCITLTQGAFETHNEDLKKEDYKIELVHSFPYVDYWSLDEAYHERYVRERWYEEVIISGIKISRRGKENPDQEEEEEEKHKNEMFVSVPRWKRDAHLHVPATLNKVVTRQKNVSVNDGRNGGKAFTMVNETRLEPFPSWAWNDIRDFPSKEWNATNVKEKLFSVVGFEIDPYNRMWILDQGRVGERNAIDGSIKLVLWDLTKDMLLDVYPFSSQRGEISLTHSFLSDIAVDVNDDIAYLSDSGIPSEESKSMELKPALLLWDRQSRSVKRALEGAPSTRVDEDLWIRVNGEKCLRDTPMRAGANGIALSCDLERLYWTPLTSRRLYSIQTDYLRLYDASDKHLVESVVDLGDKMEASDGLACTSHGNLILTGVETSTVYLAPEQRHFSMVMSQEDSRRVGFNVSSVLEIVARDTKQMIWPDSIGFGWDKEDDGPWMYYTSNNLCDFVQQHIERNTSSPTYFVWRINIGEYSYTAGCLHNTREFGWVEWMLLGCGIVSFAMAVVVVIFLTKLLDRYSAKKQRDGRLTRYEQLEEEEEEEEG